MNITALSLAIGRDLSSFTQRLPIPPEAGSILTSPLLRNINGAFGIAPDSLKAANALRPWEGRGRGLEGGLGVTPRCPWPAREAPLLLRCQPAPEEVGPAPVTRAQQRLAGSQTSTPHPSELKGNLRGLSSSLRHSPPPSQYRRKSVETMTAVIDTAVSAPPASRCAFLGTFSSLPWG